jgi:hypothetical protein
MSPQDTECQSSWGLHMHVPSHLCSEQKIEAGNFVPEFNLEQKPSLSSDLVNSWSCLCQTIVKGSALMMK